MQEFDKRKIFWRSRRGMLELDLLLVPFATQIFETLNLQDQMLYKEFLEHEDQDLTNWLMGREEPTDKRFKTLIKKILIHNKKVN